MFEINPVYILCDTRSSTMDTAYPLLKALKEKYPDNSQLKFIAVSPKVTSFTGNKQEWLDTNEETKIFEKECITTNPRNSYLRKLDSSEDERQSVIKAYDFISDSDLPSQRRSDNKIIQKMSNSGKEKAQFYNDIANFMSANVGQFNMIDRDLFNQVAANEAGAIGYDPHSLEELEKNIMQQFQKFNFGQKLESTHQIELKNNSIDISSNVMTQQFAQAAIVPSKVATSPQTL